MHKKTLSLLIFSVTLLLLIAVKVDATSVTYLPEEIVWGPDFDYAIYDYGIYHDKYKGFNVGHTDTIWEYFNIDFNVRPGFNTRSLSE